MAVTVAQLASLTPSLKTGPAARPAVDEVRMQEAGIMQVTGEATTAVKGR